MHLKNLTLKGFKSFADRASIDLEPGVTVVVGPNGSGKSNVVDAIAWVLGAQAPSAVRSGKMDDVIFAGTVGKAALGRAEVSLTIDNHSRTLPVEFNEVKITRTLFRTGDSEYAINGVPCRLLDITELLSDGGVGRQQHVIVSQGQIDGVLNARPEDRRAVIEEAAGVLKFRKRKERAERRLTATDGDLIRVKDLMREVRRQLRPLEKQAEAARRHGDLIQELTELRVHLAGREVAELRDKLRTNAEFRSERVELERATRSELEQLDAAVSADERGLADHGGDDLGDTLVRLESMRERARGLSAVLAERQRGVERDRSAFADRAVIANLEAEAARCRVDLKAVIAELDELTPERDRLATEEATLAGDRAAFREEWGDGVRVPSGQAAEMRGELGALRVAIERGTSESDRLQARLTELDQKRQELEASAAQRRADLGALHDEEEPVVAALEAAEAARAAADNAVSQAQAVQADAESEHHRWVARAEALTLALDEARSRSGAERLTDVDGVLGTLLDLVAVDEGWEAAFEAAAGDALSAVVVDGADTARQALMALADGDAVGAVLALGIATQTGGRTTGKQFVRSHVTGSTEAVDALLDGLIGDAIAVDGGWEAALDASLSTPGRVTVTRQGDRFGLAGWRIGVGSSGATGAALSEAEEQVEVTEARCADVADATTAARSELSERAARAGELTQRLDAIEAGLAADADALQRTDADRREVTTETDALQSRFDELSMRLERETARVTELDMQLPELEAAEEASLEAGRRLAKARAEMEERAATVGALRSDVDVRSAGLNERHASLTARLAGLDERLERDAEQRSAAKGQRVALDRRAEVLAKLGAAIEARTSVVDVHLTEVRERRRAQSRAAQAIAQRLDDLRSRRGEAQKQLEGLRAVLAKAEVEEAELRTRLQATVDRLRTDHDLAPDVAVSAPCPELSDGVEARRRVEMLESELDIMGPVNPLALEEYQALQERHTFLQGQLDDIRSTRRELSKVIASIDEEIVTVFASAFADVSVNFTQLFETLFPGGQGSLSLTSPEDLLNTGIEISAKPSGKNVKKLSLLSGGERTLTALAFLFAVFRSRPSPFYVMDEVEAALDDVNLHRFLSLVEEFRADAQLLLVSHQKRTMEAADCLYGVSMKSGGSSRVVSEKVAEAKAPAA
ncbi:MAG: chromosome segregation protein SMC [Acidimicrobiales bacterium]|nr:chromosome segregation protein SMC [Acidimicrobiales bacterium]